jgi:hypothetical protein
LVVCIETSRNLWNLIAEATIAPHLTGKTTLEPTPLAINIKAVLEASTIPLDARQ